MTALAKDRKTDRFGTPDSFDPLKLSFPVAAATSIYGGGMVGTDASGNAVPASASNVLKIWGIAAKQAINTTAAGYGSAGDIQVQVDQGCFLLTNGSGANAFTAADVGKLAYASDDNTVNKTDGAGLYPVVGTFLGLVGTQAVVAISRPSIWDVSDEIAGGNPAVITNVRARNVVNGNIADLTAYTVASNAAVNDATLNVAGDIVLLVAQSTPAQNGLYVVGTVATGTAPLVRHDSMPAGAAILADQYEISIAEGTVFAHTKWFNSAAVTVGTTSPAFFPESVTITQALVAGTIAALISVPILSATKTGFSFTRSTANTCTLTVNGYALSGNPTPGALGTATAAIIACVADGSINIADISTLHITITNR